MTTRGAAGNTGGTRTPRQEPMQIKQSQYRSPESKDLTEFVEHALRSSLKRFGSHLRSTVVSLHDLNGLRGGIDQECRITVRAAKGPPIVITERDSSMRTAVGRAAERIQEAVRRRAGFRLRFAGRNTQEPDSKSREIIR